MVERTSEAELNGASDGGGDVVHAENYYIVNNSDLSHKFYTDGLGSDGDTRTDAVDTLSVEVGDTLTLDGVDTYYYTATWDGVVYTRDIDPWDLNITWYDGLDNQISTGTG